MNLTLSKYGIEPNISISETHFFTLSIENKAYLLSVLSELRTQTEDGKEGTFHLLLNDKELNLEKSVSIIFDFTDIDFNSKKITNQIIKKFTDFLTFGEQLENLSKLESLVLNMAEDFRISSGLNVEYDTVMNGTNLAKVCSLRIADRGRSLLERLCEYVSLICDLKPLKLFVLVFGKQFLIEHDLQVLYKYCADIGVRLLVIEGVDKTERLPNEMRLIIDESLCSFTQGHDEI